MLNPPVSDDAVGPYICLHIVTLSYGEPSTSSCCHSGGNCYCSVPSAS